MGNLRLLSTSKRLQRNRATPPVYYITAMWKFGRLADAKIQDFMRSNLSSNLLNEVGLSLFRYFEVGLRVCDIVVNKYVRYPDVFRPPC